MGTVIVAIAKGISTSDIILRELDRIQRYTGSRPVEWMEDIHNIAVSDNTDGDRFDIEGFEIRVACFADRFIDFVMSNANVQFQY